jgi:hypothetical protein
MMTQEKNYRFTGGYTSNLIIHQQRQDMIDVVIDNSWDEDPVLKDFILNQSDNGTLFHRPLFLQYHSADKFQHTEPIKISFYKKGKIVACITGAVQHINGEKKFISPFASSYGGLIFHHDLSFKEIEDVYFELLNYLDKEYSHIKISSTPSFQSQTGKSRYIDHILLNKGFSITKSDIVLVHEVGPDETLSSRIDKKTFTELKQPLYKNKLRLEIINGIDEESYKLLLNSQERLQSTPTHTHEELLRIESLLPGTIQTFKAYSEDNFVAGIVTFRLNKNILSTFYVFDTPDGRNLKANHFTYYNVAKNAFENNYKYLDFGASSFGWLPNYPLISFKEKFDGKPFLRHIFEKQT